MILHTRHQSPSARLWSRRHWNPCAIIKLVRLVATHLAGIHFDETAHFGPIMDQVDRYRQSK